MEIVKPDLDVKQYRYVELENGIAAVLIHDPSLLGKKGPAAGAQPSKNEWLRGSAARNDEDDGEDEGGTSAAAAAVQIGSFSDPMELQGLSHYLEHMIFLGSEKYPDEAEMDSFLTRNGGGSNAWTEMEYTCFHFDVDSGKLKGALDRFAQFFIAPLFNKTSMEREVNAVDSEFTSVLQSDQGRLTQLLCHTARPGHPFGKFGWGNKASLWDGPREKGIDIHGKLTQYYRQHYGAQNLKLVLFGEETLEEQEANLRQLFGAIRRAPQDAPSFKDAGPPFEGRMLYVLPSVADGHQITVTWQLPSLKGKYEKKGDHYISHLLGHEGQGSLLAALQAQGWATELEAGVEDDGYSENSAAWLFQLQIDLTDAGLEACVRADGGLALGPLDLVFQYISLIKERGVDQRVWDELKSMADSHFRYQKEPDDVGDWVSELAPNLLKYKPEHILAGPELYGDFDPQYIHSLIDLLIPSLDSSFRVDLATSKFDHASECLGNVPFAKVDTEPWFNFTYISAPIPDGLVTKWRESSGAEKAGMAMPRPNMYIPSHFSIVTHGRRTGAPPSLVIERPGLRVWHKTSVSGRPDAVVYVKLSSPHFYSSPRHAVFTEIVVSLWKDLLQEDIHEADEAGLELDISSRGERGIVVSVEGFSDKFGVLIDRTFAALAKIADSNHCVAPHAMRMVVESLTRRFANLDLQVDRHAGHLLRDVILATSYNSSQMSNELKALDEAAIPSFLQQLLSDTHVEILAIGNMLDDDAKALAGTVHARLSSCALDAAKRPCQRVLKLHEGITYIHRHPAVNKDEDNSACITHIQIGLVSPRVTVMTELVVSLMAERAYDQLRTKEQLGYSVDVNKVVNNGVIGISFVVTTKHSPAKVDSRVDAFLSMFERDLGKLKRDEIDDYKGNVEDDKIQVNEASTLDDEAEAFWEVIDSGSYQFDEVSHELNELDKISLKDIKPWFAKYVSPGSRSRRKLTIQVLGRQARSDKALLDHLADARHHKVTAREVIIADIDLVKRTLDTYPNCNNNNPVLAGNGNGKNGAQR